MPTPTLEPTERDTLPAWKQVRRQAIIAAASKALRRQRYEQIQIKDIATSAGVALATLYRYFASKEDLYVSVLIEMSRPVTPVPEHVDSAADLLRHRVHLVYAAYEKTPAQFAVGVSLHRSEDPAVQKKLAEWDRGSTEWLMRGVKSTGDAHVDDLARLLWPIVHEGLSDAILNDGTFAEARRLTDEFIAMIANQIGLVDD